MHKIILLTISLTTLSLIGCSNGNSNTASKEFPKPGTVVAAAQMPVNDELNKFTYSIKVVADSEIKSGVYDVDVDYGPNFAEGKFTMPKGGEELKPLIRASSANSYVIGFKVAGDTTFYDYFEVSSNKGSTKMQYIKAYSF
ncbi:MAG: hypothetical protein JWQ38_3707 [Flavipsychrobacter sp.]|nr:hypothetical protein [Flavipsychrobacter sp.]